MKIVAPKALTICTFVTAIIATAAGTTALTATVNETTHKEALSDIPFETLKQAIAQIEQNPLRNDRPVIATIKNTRLHLYVDHKPTTKGIISFDAYRIGGTSLSPDGVFRDSGLMPYPALKDRINALADTGVKIIKVSTANGTIAIEATSNLPKKNASTGTTIAKVEDFQKVLDLLPVPKNLLVEVASVNGQMLNIGVAGETQNAPATVYALDFYPEH